MQNLVAWAKLKNLVAWAKLYRSKLPGLSRSVQSSASCEENVRYVEYSDCWVGMEEGNFCCCIKDWIMRIWFSSRHMYLQQWSSWWLGKILDLWGVRGRLQFCQTAFDTFPTCCFYELISERRPCKLTLTICIYWSLLNCLNEWDCWHAAVLECPKRLELINLINLDWSQMSEKGWRVSFQRVYHYINFPCKYTILKAAALALNMLPEIRWSAFMGPMAPTAVLLIQ